MSLMVPCPACGAKNRVDPARAGQAVCGKCQARVLDGKPLTVTGSTFVRQVLEAGVPVVVDFWAPWCGPCRQMAPAFEQAAAGLPGVRFAKVDTQTEPGLGQQFRIQGIPTMVLYTNGREKDRVSGALPTQQIVDWVRQRM